MKKLLGLVFCIVLMLSVIPLTASATEILEFLEFTVDPIITGESTALEFYTGKEKVLRIENFGTTDTTPTTFSPGTTCTRGQIVTFLDRTVKKIKKV